MYSVIFSLFELKRKKKEKKGKKEEGEVFEAFNIWMRFSAVKPFFSAISSSFTRLSLVLFLPCPFLYSRLFYLFILLPSYFLSLFPPSSSLGHPDLGEISLFEALSS